MTRAINQSTFRIDEEHELVQATKAGKITNHKAYEGRTWKQEYEYHLGVKGCYSLPFDLFRLKFDALNGMFELDPDGKNPRFDRPIMDLCNALGY